MPEFETPEPISVNVEVSIGNLRITGGDRLNTVVEVRPSDPADESDIEAAQQVRVDYANGMLRVTGPKPRLFDFSRKTRSVEVSIELPARSQVTADVQMGDFHCAGVLGECRLKTSMGNLSLQQSGPLRFSTSYGHVTAGGIAGDADISTGSGKIRLGEIEGAAAVKNSNGETAIDTVAGDLRVRSANGDISIERAGAGVDAKTACGSIRVGEVVRGSVVLGTAAGNLDIGIAEGTAAWLEVNTGFGHMRNLLENATRPEEANAIVEVRGRTSYGDITIHRS